MKPRSLTTILLEFVVAGLAVASISFLWLQPLSAKTFDLGAEQLNEFKPAVIVLNPQPVIPSRLHDEAFTASCLARFNISSEGQSKVSLLTTSGSDEIDEITLSSLRLWKFRPAMLDGKPVDSTRRIRIEFEIN